MRRVELLIDMSRKETGNTRYGDDSGIPQDVYVQRLNNAQDELLKQIVNLKTKYLLTSEIVPVVPGQTIYDYPEMCYMQHVDTIQWYDSSTGAYYQTLVKSFVKEMVNNITGYAFGYTPYMDGIHLNPPINNGYLNVIYAKAPPRLQKRNGQITVATIVGSNLTALSINTATPGIDETEIENYNYLCVVDRAGNVKTKNIPYDSYSAGTFTLSPFALGTQTLAVGDYVIIGENCTNLPQWPDICESFLLKFLNYETKYGDASSWTKAVQEDMSKTFDTLSGSFATLK
jgi:hypothetical protein